LKRRNYPASDKWFLATLSPDFPGEWCYAYFTGKRLVGEGVARRTIIRQRDGGTIEGHVLEPDRRWFLGNFEIGVWYEVVV